MENSHEILAYMLEFSKKVSEMKDFTLLETTLVDYAKKITKADRATIWFCNDLNKTLYTGIADGIDNEVIPIDSGIVGSCIGDDCSTISNNMHKDSRFYPGVEHKTGYIAKNCIVVPFKNPNYEVIGAIQVLNKNYATEQFNNNDLELLEFLVTFATNILHTLFVNFQINKIFEYTTKISDETDTEKLLITFTKMGKDVLRADRATIWLYDKEKEILWTKVAIGIEKLELDSKSGIVGEAFTTQEVIVCNDPYKDPRFNQEIDRKSGYITQSIIATPLKDSHNNVIGVFQCINKKSKKSEFLYSDITRMKIVSTYIANTLDRSSLMNLNEELEKRVQEETNKRVMQEKISLHNAKMAEMGGMIEAIIHQWKQPIAAITIVTDMSLYTLAYDNVSLEELEKNFAKIKRNIHRLNDTIDDFRNFFKPDRDKKIVNIASILHKVSDIMSHQLMKFNAILLVTCEPHIETLGFPNEIIHVLINIINNSLEAIQENKNVANNKPHITITVIQHNESIDMHIQDNSGGIPDAIMQNIFQPYNSSKGEKGTGIGLALAKTIIEEHHNGKIFVHNKNDGAEFTINLPRK